MIDRSIDDDVGQVDAADATPVWFRGDHAYAAKDTDFHEFALLDANCVSGGVPVLPSA